MAKIKLCTPYNSCSMPTNTFLEDPASAASDKKLNIKINKKMVEN